MKTIVSLSMAVLLAGCTVGPDYHGPPMIPLASAGQAHGGSGFVRAADPTYTAAPGLARWWETLDDPDLTALVDEALAHSPDMALAQARIREADAQAGEQDTMGLPTASASAAYLNARIPGGALGGEGAGKATTLHVYHVGTTASWEPDIFGGARRGSEEAQANVDKSFADLGDAQVSLSAKVAQAYVSLRDVQARIALYARSIDLQKQALALTQRRLLAGTATALDVDRLRNGLDTLIAQSIPLQAQCDGYLNQLAVLTGNAPGGVDARLATTTPIPLPPAQVPIGDPTALVAHRPDIRSAERALAAGTAEIGMEKAKLFPSLNFLGVLGLGGSRPGDIAHTGNLTGLLAPMLKWNFLNFGRQRATVHQAEARRDEAEAQYRKVVLAALEDAENSLSQFGNDRQELERLVQAEQSATRSLHLNELRLAAGTSTVIEQIDIERQSIAAQVAVTQAKARLTNSFIGVQKSLGLGWQD